MSVNIFTLAYFANDSDFMDRLNLMGFKLMHIKTYKV